MRLPPGRRKRSIGSLTDRGKSDQARFLERLVGTTLGNGLETTRADLDLHVAIELGDPDPLGVQIGQESPARLVVRVRNIVARHGALSGDLANA